MDLLVPLDLRRHELHHERHQVRRDAAREHTSAQRVERHSHTDQSTHNDYISGEREREEEKEREREKCLLVRIRKSHIHIDVYIYIYINMIWLPGSF